MIKNNEILAAPLDIQGMQPGNTLEPGGFGAVLARAGVGKTALIVQVALSNLAAGNNLLHISLNEPIAKVDAHYREVFDRLAQQHQWANSEAIWDDLACRRFIMTFQVEGFSVPKLEERLTDLTAQNIFHPHMIIIDRLPFDRDMRSLLEALKSLAAHADAPIWFTITTHRHESPAPDGLPVQFSPVQDLFDVALVLQPKDQVVEIKVLKGGREVHSQPDLILDPVTMLIRSRT